jgi:peptidoglycan/xylan/chitin deacetylase (PgdA/CDA1 family)
VPAWEEVTAVKRAILALLLVIGAMFLLAWAAPAYGGGSGTVSVAEDTTPTVPTYPAWMKRYWGHRVHRAVTTKKVVALTFDDGPTTLTDDFVRVLERYDVKGTFFVTGSQSKRKFGKSENLYVLKHGFELANHTMYHQRLDKSYAYDVKAINDLETLLKKQTGHGTRWVRAMGGDVTRTGLRATRGTHHLYAQWSVSSGDSVLGYSPPHRLYHHVVDHVRPGSIVLMHVTHPETLAALPAIVRNLKSRGYKMVTLSEMAAMGKPYPSWFVK